ncbi:hypothetical protein PLEOSDRAFT_1053349 [Pleurotus ostreatus PC15]|uniref:Uncharacterized protein n=1 Tax=Pleurotus ostreatus (strain PC15) TaxID=1137138 RepID=A0A067P853_PLEO1|nr:hypothetical protein PLEOSDRAFT_1053349 [Pleurotus ostreatus PC15]
MFSTKSVFGAILALAFSAQVSAHAGATPALGVAGQITRGDVERPSTANPCGEVNIAQNLNTATPIVAAADGTFTAAVQNFNGGRDGSRQFTVAIDAAAAGTNFVPATVTKNGDPAPAAVGTEQLVGQLPAGTTCTGGQAGNLCLAQFKSSAGFGNCAVIQQGAAAAAGNAAATAGNAAAGNAVAGAIGAGAAGGAAAAAAASAAGTGRGRRPQGGRGRGRNAAAAAGTRAPRALLHALRTAEEKL